MNPICQSCGTRLENRTSGPECPNPFCSRVVHPSSSRPANEGGAAAPQWATQAICELFPELRTGLSDDTAEVFRKASIIARFAPPVATASTQEGETNFAWREKWLEEHAAAAALRFELAAAKAELAELRGKLDFYEQYDHDIAQCAAEAWHDLATFEGEDADAQLIIERAIQRVVGPHKADRVELRARLAQLEAKGGGPTP